MVTKAHPLLAPIVSPSSLPSGLSHCPSPFMKQKSTGSSEGGGSVPPGPAWVAAVTAGLAPTPASPLHFHMSKLLCWFGTQNRLNINS